MFTGFSLEGLKSDFFCVDKNKYTYDEYKKTGEALFDEDISDAGYAGKNTEGKDTYYRNATFVIDDGSDLALLVVITNTKDAYSGVIKDAK